MESFNLSILFGTIRGIVPKFNAIHFHEIFHDIGCEFFSLIGTYFLNVERSSSEYLLKKITCIHRIGCLIAPCKDPSGSIINDSVDGFFLFVDKSILGIHLELFFWYLMGVELFLPLTLGSSVSSCVTSIGSFQDTR